MTAELMRQNDPLHITVLPIGEKQYHIKQFLMSYEALSDILSLRGRFDFANGLPKDARIIWVFLSEDRDGIVIRAEHPSFPPIRATEMIPTEPLLFVVRRLNL